MYDATQFDNDSDSPAKMISDSENEEEILESGFGGWHYKTMIESNDEKVISKMVTKFFN